MRDAGQGETHGLAHAPGPKAKYDKQPVLGIFGMSGLRGFTDDLLVKTQDHAANNKVFVTEKKTMPHVDSIVSPDRSLNISGGLSPMQPDQLQSGVLNKKHSTASLLQAQDKQFLTKTNVEGFRQSNGSLGAGESQSPFKTNNNFRASNQSLA